MLLQLLNGISLDIKLNVWKKIADVLLKLIESGDIDAQLMPIVGGLAPAFLLKVNGSLNIEIDEYMKQKIQENPMVEPILMDAATLVSATSNVSSDDELEEYLEQSVPPHIALIARILIKHLGDEVNFTALHPNFGIRGRFHGDGLNLLIKTLVKYYS